MPESSELEKLAALKKWAQRVLSAPPTRVPERRRHARNAQTEHVQVIPIDRNTMQPLVAQKLSAVTRDVSVSGVGLVVNAQLDLEFYFIELSDGSTALAKLRRRRQVQGSVMEYGFEVLARRSKGEAV
jgi:hypothetical protein